MKEMYNIRQLLVEGSGILQLVIADEGIDNLECYYHELIRWGKKINLIAKKQKPAQIIENHFLDSLILLKYIENNGCSLVDVGSGAGFPGLVCKAVLPKLHLTLIEPRLKRVSFLRHIIRSLNLKKVEVVAQRVEDIPQNDIRGTHITSRAVAEVVDFLKMAEHLCDDEVKILCMKGPKWKEELTRSSSFLAASQIELIQVDEFKLPFSGSYRAVLSFAKKM